MIILLVIHKNWYCHKNLEISHGNQWLETMALLPPPPRICVSPGGPAVSGPRIKLRDGRHLAYKEHGVPKETAKYKVIYAHSLGSTKYELAVAPLETLEELGAYVVSFDRPGYGESDPHPKRTIQTTALDMEELADQLGLCPKFYVMGFSIGDNAVWGCLKSAGAALVAPVVSYWWLGFPTNLSTEGYNLQFPRDQWALRVAHYAPWLVYWWNTQKWFPYNSAIAGKFNRSPPDMEVSSRFAKHAR
ncbi:putative diphosphomevalonate decarboxylase-like [Capsicum annuum]|nr:putative diphosphomevalonate decarboxylase-like [Capsicum annuum]